jgi:hypothetical protein
MNKLLFKEKSAGDSPDAQFMANVSVLKMNPFVTPCTRSFLMYVLFHRYAAEAISGRFRSLPYSCRNSL